MRLTGIAISALAVALTCGTGAAFAQYGYAPQREYRQPQDRTQYQSRDRDDRRDADAGYSVYGGYSNQSAYSGYAQRGYRDGDEGARIYVETRRVPRYSDRDDDRRFRQDDRQNNR